jgi:uncharacterized protein YjbI with pentapeptide repeats
MRFKSKDGSLIKELQEFRDLRSETFELISFSGSDLSSCTMKGARFTNCEFEDVNFQYSNITDCAFYECNFLNCNFSDTKADYLRSEDCSFDGCDFTYSKLRSAYIDSDIQKCRFVFCDLEFASFVNSKISETSFSNSTVLETDFRWANLEGVDFSYVANWNRIQLAKPFNGRKVTFPDTSWGGSTEQKHWDMRRKVGR